MSTPAFAAYTTLALSSNVYDIYFLICILVLGVTINSFFLFGDDYISFSN